MVRLSPRSWLLAVLPAAGTLVLCMCAVFLRPGTSGIAELAVTDSPSPPAFYEPKRMDFPAIQHPPLKYADEVNLDDEAIVIGIVVHGEPRAYLREAFEMSPDRHVVTDSIESTPVTVTHCDRIRCTRVFVSPEADAAPDIRVGGWRTDQTLALIVNGKEFSQKSPKIPLADVPFLELPWGTWRERYPDTLVYLGAGNARSM